MCLGSRRSIELDFLVLSAVWSCEERELLSPKRRRLEKNGAKGGDTERRSSKPSHFALSFPAESGDHWDMYEGGAADNTE